MIDGCPGTAKIFAGAGRLFSGILAILQVVFAKHLRETS
jgi:hypothetical protein